MSFCSKFLLTTFICMITSPLFAQEESGLGWSEQAQQMNNDSSEETSQPSIDVGTEEVVESKLQDQTQIEQKKSKTIPANTQTEEESLLPQIQTNQAAMNPGLNAPQIFKNEGFRMSLPNNWEVQVSEEPGVPIEFLAPKVEGATYRGNIKVMKFSGSLNLTDKVADDFAEKISKKHSYIGYVSDYKIRNFDYTELNDQTRAILYYADLKANNVALMQAHVLLTGENHHYLVTYTDIAAHFEGPTSYVFLETVWSSMSSIELLDPKLTTVQRLLKYSPWIALTIFLMFAAYMLRMMWLKREERIEPLDNPEFADDDALITSRAELESIIAAKANNYSNNWSNHTPDGQFSSIFDVLPKDQEVSKVDLVEDEDDEQIAV